MASIAGGADRQMSVGRVFNRAFGTIGANPVTMFGIAFLFGALPSLLLGTVLPSARVPQNAVFTAAWVLSASGAGLLAVACTFLAQGALVRVTVAHSEGRRASFGEASLAGLRKILPLLVLGILLGLGVMVGLLFLIVPGIILYLVWSVATPALVEERIGIFGAFGRSADLTRGARWSVFGVQLVALLLYWIVAAATGAVMVMILGVQGMVAAGEGTTVTPLVLLISAVRSTLVLAIIAAIQTSLYVELRDWKDGPATEALTAIFD
ncbi:hypothetical protein U1872_17605 [Sphingomonas sp. RB3P16]|uniref:hypothetical protein n=1 Tax=Parasphingomonas frigoris TaxID=3096163 RepID=UPI002FCA7002